MSEKEVWVIGCGVSGLTCGIRLLEAGFGVTILARELPPHTTSNVAAAVWYPYKAYPVERVLEWSRVSLEVFYGLMNESGTGISAVSLLEPFRQPVPDPWWKTAVRHFQRASLDKLPDGYVDGYWVEVPLIETPLYMAWLFRRFQQSGGKIEQRTLTSLAEVSATGRLVVNCAGLGARELTHDPNMYAIRGQIVKVNAPHVRQCVIDEHHPAGVAYVVPRQDGVVLGGTAEIGDERLTIDPETAESIVQKCCQLNPQLKTAEIVAHAVGLRPGREVVRLELEQQTSPLIHNYGHGGAGFTLSWGCAAEVVGLAGGST